MNLMPNEFSIDLAVCGKEEGFPSYYGRITKVDVKSLLVQFGYTHASIRKQPCGGAAFAFYIILFKHLFQCSCFEHFLTSWSFQCPLIFQKLQCTS